jgi:uncharacterized protein (DUF1800 family)
VTREFRTFRELPVLGILLLLTSTLVSAGEKNSPRIEARRQSPQFAAFANPLSKTECFNHALDRLTFGPRPGDSAALQKIGLKKWIDSELHPERIAENPILAQRLAPLASLRMSIHDTFVQYPPRQKGGSADDTDLQRARISDILTPGQIDTLQIGTPQAKRALLENIPPEKRAEFISAMRPGQMQGLFSLAPVEFRREMMLSINPRNVVAMDLSEGKLLRAIYSNHQFEELLVDFWFNHFNVFINKGEDRFSLPTYEREAIRPHVFGKFFDLLLDTAKSPAMLFYLDNWQSVGDDSPAAGRAIGRKQKQRGLNENYGRELMELHTLGVDGGYTQQDVINVARCFTGWTIAAPRKGGEFEYNDRMHDKGEKVVLGHVIPAGGGMNDGIAVLEILAHHPATAHFISLQLAKRFVADDPPPSLVNRMAQKFAKSNGDLRAVYATMINSPEFWSRGAYCAKVKTPFEMVVSAVRATNADVTSAFLLAQELNKLGEPLYRKIEPTGYSSTNAEWVSSADLLNRMNFAMALAHNKIPGVSVDIAQWRNADEHDPIALARQILEQDPSEQTQAAIQKAVADPDLQTQLPQNANAGASQLPSLIAGLVIGSPEFQRR